MLIKLPIAILLFWMIKPSSGTIGAARWGRHSAAWVAMLSALNPTIGRFEVDAIAAWSVGVVLLPPIAYLIGVAGHYLFRGAKQAKDGVPVVLNAVLEKTSGVTGHVRDKINPYDPSDSKVYAAVSAEMKQVPLDDGLWTKALALANGNEVEAKACYIKLRVNQLKNSDGLEHRNIAPQEVSEGTPSMQNQQSSCCDTQQGQEATMVNEDDIYAGIANEFETSIIDKGLWTRLFAEFNGDERQMKVHYIKQRADRLIAQEQTRLAGLDLARKEQQRLCEAEAARMEAKRLENLPKKMRIAERITKGNFSLPSADYFLDQVAKGNTSKIEELLATEEMYVAASDAGTGNSPLHIAVVERNRAMIRLLLRCGASASSRNAYGLTPLDFAKKDQDTQEIFLEEGIAL